MFLGSGKICFQRGPIQYASFLRWGNIFLTNSTMLTLDFVCWYLPAESAVHMTYSCNVIKCVKWSSVCACAMIIYLCVHNWIPEIQHPVDSYGYHHKLAQNHQQNLKSSTEWWEMFNDQRLIWDRKIADDISVSIFFFFSHLSCFIEFTEWTTDEIPISVAKGMSWSLLPIQKT